MHFFPLSGGEAGGEARCPDENGEGEPAVHHIAHDKQYGELTEGVMTINIYAEVAQEWANQIAEHQPR